MCESISCDVCGKKITEFDTNLYHMTVMLDGVINRHTHMCLNCYINNVTYVPVIKTTKGN